MDVGYFISKAVEDSRTNLYPNWGEIKNNNYFLDH